MSNTKDLTAELHKNAVSEIMTESLTTAKPG